MIQLKFENAQPIFSHRATLFSFSISTTQSFKSEASGTTEI
jgi:hypothetical protein